MIRPVLVALVSLCVALPAQIARTAPGDLPRQAKTPEEFDLYLDFVQARDTELKHRAALKFEQVYPNSELLVYVYQGELEYARDRNLQESAVAVGEKALALVPDDVVVLLLLAEIIPAGDADARALDRSEKYARRVLELSESRRVSPELTLDDCDALRRKLRSRAHAALGLIALKHGAAPLATREFETAVSESPGVDGVQLYRLARLYLAFGRQADATVLLRKALQIGPPEISSLAAVELKKGKGEMR